MQEFIKRNSPIFLIGGVTLFVFIGIIFLAQKNGNVGTNLQPIDDATLIAEHSPSKGPEASRVTLVEFSDFGCSACSAFHPILMNTVGKYPNQLRVVYRNSPLPQHKNSREAAIAALAANEQDKFWEYATMLYENQTDFSRETLMKYASDIGLDTEKFQSDYANPTLEENVDTDIRLASKLRLNSTPTFFLNGVKMEINTIDDFETQVENAIKSAYASVDASPTPNGLETEDSTETTEASETPELTTQEFAEIVRTAFDNTYGIITITYNDTEGFTPYNLNAIQGQLVIFKNETDHEIRIQQLIKSYDQFATPVTIPAESTFEMRLLKDKLWTFKERDNRHYGSIFVLQPKADKLNN